VSRTAVNSFLAAYLCVVWTAAMARFDEFPLTWVSMYARYEPDELLSLRVADQAAISRGLRATARDGSTRWLTRRDLNVTKKHFRRLYWQRMFTDGPRSPWPYRILRSVNRTLGYAPNDPRFIVRLEADIDQVSMRKTDLAIVDRKSRHVTHEWRDEYLERWRDEGP
jgi:hypothetical protein